LGFFDHVHFLAAFCCSSSLGWTFSLSSINGK